MSSLKQVTLKTWRGNVEKEAANKVLGSRGIEESITLLAESWEITNQDFHYYSAFHGFDVNRKQQKTSSILHEIASALDNFRNKTHRSCISWNKSALSLINFNFLSPSRWSTSEREKTQSSTIYRRLYLFMNYTY